MSLESISVKKSIILNQVLFPLTWQELLNSLLRLGYELSPSFPYPLPTGRVSGRGHIARKGKTAIWLDSGSKEILVFDDSINSCIEEFDSVLNQIQEDHEINFHDYSRFYQFQGNFCYMSDINAYDSIRRASEHSNLERISEILGERVSSFGFRFGKSDSIPNSENWFDIKITPDIQRNRGYYIEVVYRREEREIVNNFMNNFNNYINNIIELIEES